MFVGRNAVENCDTSSSSKRVSHVVKARVGLIRWNIHLTATLILHTQVGIWCTAVVPGNWMLCNRPTAIQIAMIAIRPLPFALILFLQGSSANVNGKRGRNDKGGEVEENSADLEGGEDDEGEEDEDEDDEGEDDEGEDDEGEDDEGEDSDEGSEKKGSSAGPTKKVGGAVCGML